MTNSPSCVSAVSQSSGRNRIPLLLQVLGCWLVAVSPLLAQVRPVAIQEATILTGDGRTIERGTVVFQGGKISAVGRKAEVSFMAKKIQAAGKYVTPGLIDAHSTLALRFAPAGDQATAKAVDGFDRYAEDEIRAALREGVTAIYVPSRSASGIGGLGAVIRLQPRPGDDWEEFVLTDEAALCAAVGAQGSQGPLARVKAAEALRQRFRAAKEYRQAWEDYEEDLEEYEKKLVERAKKKAQEKKAEEKKQPSKKGTGGKKNAPSRDRQKPDQDKPRKKDEKKEELKKPTEPKKDRNAEVLLRVIDGELRLRVEAHHPADILNVLQIAEEFNAALILEGATGAHLVADRLAELEVPVVLSAPPAPVVYVPGAGRHARPDAAAILREAGVDVYFGSGVLPSPTAPPQLALRVARAVGHGFDADAALETITFKAAGLLGVEKEIGRVKRGLRADLVIWSDHPFAPGATVERVFVGGREVYHADSDKEGRDE